MAFVIRTDKFTRPHYWCGLSNGSVGQCAVISTVIFNAWHFDDRAEVEDVVKKAALDNDWTISVVSSGTSPALARKRR